MKKNYKKNKYKDPRQRSFFFQDYLETNKNKINSSNDLSEDRIYILFFSFFCLILLFSIKISIVSIQNPKVVETQKNINSFTSVRRDIVDRNGTLVARNIRSYHAAVKPDLIKDKKNFLLKLKINFPNISQEKLKKKIYSNRYFYLKKRLTENEKNKLWSMGEKGIIFEPYQSRIYPQGNLYSHIIGQIDNDNYGISGIEKNLDFFIKDPKKIDEPISLSIDTNIQYLIKKELESSLKNFKAAGAAAVLINSNNGEILSLVSLPDYNINIRENISSLSYTNKITKGVFELGSVFKTFTVALALQNNIVEPDTLLTNIPNKISCSKYKISDIKVFPKNMTVEDILIRSSNIGTLKLARKIGKNNFKEFIEKLDLMKTPELELEEVGSPIKFKWHKCKLETVSYGHGITTTPLQVASAYASLSNGGFLIKPTLIKGGKKNYQSKQIISKETSEQISNILRKVVTDENGTASLADIYGYNVGGKTGTSQKYNNKDENINTFVSVFPNNNPSYTLLVMLDNPQPAPHIIYNYRGSLIKVNRNEAGWNSVYVAGKIIKKIGPILAINKNQVKDRHVVKKPN